MDPLEQNTLVAPKPKTRILTVEIVARQRILIEVTEPDPLYELDTKILRQAGQEAVDIKSMKIIGRALDSKGWRNRDDLAPHVLGDSGVMQTINQDNPATILSLWKQPAGDEDNSHPGEQPLHEMARISDQLQIDTSTGLLSTPSQQHQNSKASTKKLQTTKPKASRKPRHGRNGITKPALTKAQRRRVSLTEDTSKGDPNEGIRMLADIQDQRFVKQLRTIGVSHALEHHAHRVERRMRHRLRGAEKRRWGALADQLSDDAKMEAIAQVLEAL